MLTLPKKLKIKMTLTTQMLLVGVCSFFITF